MMGSNVQLPRCGIPRIPLVLSGEGFDPVPGRPSSGGANHYECGNSCAIGYYDRSSDTLYCNKPFYRWCRTLLCTPGIFAVLCDEMVLQQLQKKILRPQHYCWGLFCVIQSSNHTKCNHITPDGTSYPLSRGQINVLAVIYNLTYVVLRDSCYFV